MLRRVSLVVCLLALVGCSSPKTSERPLPTPNPEVSQTQPIQTASQVPDQLYPEQVQPVQTANQIPGQPYPKQVVQNFMSACVAQSGLPSTCSCLVTGIQQNFSFQDYLALEQQASTTGQMPQSFVQIAGICHQQTIAQQSASNRQGSLKGQIQSQQLADAQLQRQYVLDHQRSLMQMALESQKGQQRMGEIMMRNIGEVFQQRYNSQGSNTYPCDYPHQQDSMGRACGDRAASVRPGGRL